MPRRDPQSLDSLRLQLPDLSGGEPDMAFRVADSTAGLLAELHTRLVGLGQRATDWKTSPESVGWLTLWTRTLAVAQANQASCAGGSLFGVQTLWRSAFELQYHLMVISDPSRIRWPDSVQGETPETEMSACDRLCAYVAYCLWNDSKYFESLTKGWLLRTLWSEEEQPAVGAQAEFQKLARHILREDEDAGDPRAAQGRNRRWALGEKDRVDGWLDHPRLAHWQQAIRAIHGGRGPYTFYGVLNPGRDSLAQDTFKTPFAVATPEYNRVSALFHGTTIEGFLETREDSIRPTPTGLAELDRQVRTNIYSLIMCWLLLHSLAAQVDELAG